MRTVHVKNHETMSEFVKVMPRIQYTVSQKKEATKLLAITF